MIKSIWCCLIAFILSCIGAGLPLASTQMFSRVLTIKKVNLQGLAIQELPKGGYLIAANHGAPNYFQRKGRLFLLRLAADGRTLWKKRYPYAMLDRASIVLYQSRLFVLTAHWLLEFDGQGKVLWKYRALSLKKGSPTCAIGVGKGVVVMAGVHNQGGVWFAAVDVVKKRTLWKQRHSFVGVIEVLSLLALPQGGLLATGRERYRIFDRVFGYYVVDRAFLVRMTAHGKVVWQRAFFREKSNTHQTGYAIALHPKGCLVAANRQSYFGRGYTGDGKSSLTQVSLDGKQRKQRVFKGGGVDFPVSLARRGTVYGMLMHHTRYATSIGRGYARLSMWDASLKPLWARDFKWGFNSRGRGLIQTRDGGFAWVGWLAKKLHGTMRLWIVKTTSNGRSAKF